MALDEPKDTDDVFDVDGFQYLVDKGVLCAPRGGGIRFSPHFHTPREQLETVVNYVNNY